ncbi:MAG: ABC transporter permease [Parcubacteria group bacterium]
MWRLFWANIKMTFRDKQAIFWSLVFPLMFIIIFGLFNFERMGDAKYIALDNAQTDTSSQFLEGFTKIEFLKRQEFTGTLDEAKTQLTDGGIDFILVIPEKFDIAVPDMPAELPPGVEIPIQPFVSVPPLEVYYNESNITVNQVALSVVDKFIDSMNMQIGNTPQLFSYESESIQTKDVKYIDVIMPGILGMAIMMSAVIGISTGITRYRERKLLKRLSATPLKVRDFLIAEVLSYLAVNVIQITLIILLAQTAFKVNVYGSYILIYAICIFGSLIFLNIGFAVAGYAKNVKTAESLSQVITMPMMFFSGVFFSTETLPKIVARIVEYLPLTPIVEALRSVSIDEKGLAEIWVQLAFMGGWIVISFLLAWKAFKFKD